MIAQLERIPPLSLTRALSLPHGDFDVLLGVDVQGRPVLHPARVQDGGAPSLLLLGLFGDEIEHAIIASCISWYQDTATCVPGFYGLSVEWAAARLLVTWRSNRDELVGNGARCYCREVMRGVWMYYRRNCAPVGFYACLEQGR